jgi:hypothetical protein
LNSTVFAQKGQKMIKKPLYFIMLAIFLLSACASQPADESDELSPVEGEPVLAESSESEEDPDELICRREQVTGSNFSRRVCMTRAERDLRRQETQEDVLRRRSTNDL